VHQKLWGYKVEEKLYLGVREQKMLNTAVTVNTLYTSTASPISGCSTAPSIHRTNAVNLQLIYFHNRNVQHSSWDSHYILYIKTTTEFLAYYLFNVLWVNFFNCLQFCVLLCFHSLPLFLVLLHVEWPCSMQLKFKWLAIATNIFIF
jgi:hypothetical protein